MSVAPCYFIDIGSTMIKGVRVNGESLAANAFHKRKADRAIPEQVLSVLAELGCREPVNDADIRICSSANGGLSVGVLSLTRKASGAVALRMLESVGANVRFHYVWREVEGSPGAPHVDVLFLVGGIDVFSSRTTREGLYALSLSSFSYDRLVYAGHAATVDTARSLWPDVETVPNPLVGGLVPADRSLGLYARQTYLDDIESKKDLQPLRNVSRVPIEPTPSIVSKAFARLQSRIPSPAIMLDIGGATTDLHFTKEALDESVLTAGELATFPAIARYVFTAYGVHDSKATTIAALLADSLGVDLLAALFGGEHRTIYQQLLDGQATEHLLFCASIFLALRACMDGKEEAPRIKLGAMASLMITGGAAKCLGVDDVTTTLSVALGWTPRASIFRDANYRWWILGLMESSKIPESTWGSLDG